MNTQIFDYNNANTLIEIQKNPTYENCVEPVLNKFKMVVLDDEMVSKIKKHIELCVLEKRDEEHYQEDSGMMHKRWFNGCAGEAVVEKFLGVKFIDWNIGRSTLFNVGDLKPLGINCGVKTSEYGNFPIVHKNPEREEIFVLKKSENEYYVCGVANQTYLKYYQSDELIKSPNLKAKGTKSGFWGFFRLKQFETLDELKEFLT